MKFEDWLRESGYFFGNYIHDRPKGKRMTEEQKQALKKVIEYLSDEKKDFEAQGNPTNHIYSDIQVLERYLGQPSI